MSREQQCPAGAIEVYEVRYFPRGGGFKRSELLLTTDDKKEAEELAASKHANVQRRFAVRLPTGRFWLLASVYPIKEPKITRQYPPWCQAFVDDATMADNLAYDAANGLLDDNLPKFLKRLARRLRLASSAMGGIQCPETIPVEASPTA